MSSSSGWWRERALDGAACGREAPMGEHPETAGGFVSRFREMWERGERPDPARCASGEPGPGAFCARHLSYVRSGLGFGGREHTVFVNETFGSSMECLAFYRWMRVPWRLAEAADITGPAAGLPLERLLDATEYSTALVAEELMSMMDECLGRGSCTRDELAAMRQAYNNMSGFHQRCWCEIVCWGPIGEVLSDNSLLEVMKEEPGATDGLRVLVETGLFDPADRAHLRVAGRFLRMTSAV